MNSSPRLSRRPTIREKKFYRRDSGRRRNIIMYTSKCTRKCYVKHKKEVNLYRYYIFLLIIAQYHAVEYFNQRMQTAYNALYAYNGFYKLLKEILNLK